jgi:hypothetical protein
MIAIAGFFKILYIIGVIKKGTRVAKIEDNQFKSETLQI